MSNRAKEDLKRYLREIAKEDLSWFKDDDNVLEVKKVINRMDGDYQYVELTLVHGGPTIWIQVHPDHAVLYGSWSPEKAELQMKLDKRDCIELFYHWMEYK